VALRRAVARLPERQRLTLALKVQEDLRFEDVARILGCPVGTAKANFHHAVKNLKKLLGAADDRPARDEAILGEGRS
jgi:RNA polymerase sigma-70 factor (ECF subfamily)